MSASPILPRCTVKSMPNWPNKPAAAGSLKAAARCFFPSGSALRPFRLPVFLAAALLSGCLSLPSQDGREQSSFIDTAASPLLTAALRLPPLDNGTSPPEISAAPKQPENGEAAPISVSGSLKADGAGQPEHANDTPAAVSPHSETAAAAGDADNRQPENSAAAAVAPLKGANGESSLKSAEQPSPQPHPAGDGRLPTLLYVIDDAQDAFVARAELIDHAQVSLDIRYYIWRKDLTGRLLMQKVLAAADRGVRVRLLLDDNNTRGMDGYLAAVNRHPNISVRLFNPFLHRKWRFLGYLTDFPRLNRRMHNKSLTADNQMAVIGGRNIGDSYFGSHPDTAFADTDVLLAGPVVREISQDFDRYWHSDSAYPFERIVANAQPETIAAAPDTAQRAFLQTLADSPLRQAVDAGRVDYIRADTRLVSDDPDKALDRRIRINIADEIEQAMQTPAREMYLVSAYFVPGRSGLKLFDSLARRGVAVTVFTNSLRATDVAAVHSGYARYRRRLLESGVTLYEFKPGQAVAAHGKDKGLTGSSTSLHAKTFIFDRERVFVGSFNLDPRSARLNTEMGLMIYHPPLAAQMQQHLERVTAAEAYRVSLDSSGKLRWYDPQTGETSNREPEAGTWKRLLNNFLSLLPIERLL